jgi:hypothetical protein
MAADVVAAVAAGVMAAPVVRSSAVRRMRALGRMRTACAVRGMRTLGCVRPVSAVLYGNCD